MPTTAAAPKDKRRGLWQAAGIALLTFLTLGFSIYATARGLSFADPVEQAASRFYVFAAPLGNAAIYAHMATGGLLTVLAPLQLWPAPRRRWPRLHRINGRVVGVLAVITALGGLAYIAARGTIGGVPMSAGSPYMGCFC